MPDLLALAARAEAGGDPTLSDDVWRALGWRRPDDETPQRWISPHGGIYDSRRPDLLTSIDAQEAAGPAITRTQQHGSGRWQAIAWSGKHFNGVAPTEPLARLAAKLRALAAATPETRDAD